MKMSRYAVILAGAALIAHVAQGASIWVEGETAVRADVTRHSWYDSVRNDALSGGAWISHFNKAKEGTLEYEIVVAEPGDYVFWLRANPTRTKLAYQFDTNAWQDADLAADMREEMNIAADNKPDLRFIAWFDLGTVRLKKGMHVLKFRIHGDPENHGAIDCFCLSNDGFAPAGLSKPGVGLTKTRAANQGEVIWIEGEAEAYRTVTPHLTWYDKVKKNLLSGGDWVHHWGDQPGTVEYSFNVAVPDQYTFWLRANPTGTKLSYRLDSNDWQLLDMQADQRGNINIAEDDKIDLRFIAWMQAGRIPLSKGQHTIAFKMHSDTSNHGGIDCFTFVRVPFAPDGTNRPTFDAPATGGPDDWFAVTFDDDKFSDASVIDLSQYIEAPAGAHGFLTRAGEALKFQNAKDPVKFWGCGANFQYGAFTRTQLKQRIRYLKKYGVNMIRQHPVFDDLGPLRDGHFDPDRLRDWDWWCAELKTNGIYMTWSVFYPLQIGKDDGYDPALFAELESGRGGLRSTYGLVNVERKLQDLQLAYVTALLQHTNEFTGIPYANEPALAVLEIQNEDCVFFGNPLSTLADGKKWPLHSKRLRQKWCAWVKEKYKTAAAVTQAWGRLVQKDRFAEGELALMAAYHLGAAGPLYEFQGQTARAGDQIRFLTELQRAFYARREKEVRALGFKAVTVSTAWRAGGAAADPANTFCDTLCDMIDRHNYFGGGVGGHGITEGKVNNESHLGSPGGGLLASGMYQVENRPFCMTEWTQCPPNQWKLEAAPLMAFYGMGLQGWDVSYHFLNGRVRMGNGWPNQSSYVTDTPHYIGQFPALAFAIMNKHLKEAPVAAARRLGEQELYRGTDPLQQDFTGGGHDVKALKGALGTPAEALAIGKVTVGFQGGQSEQVDLNKYWDKAKKVVRSITGELVWDYGRQTVTIAAPKTQGVIGRAGGRTINLPGVSIKVKTPFVSLLFTPLDNQPLTNSARILITAMAQDKQMGTKYNEEGTQLLVVGAPPLLMEPVQAVLRFKGNLPAEINVLDVYGVPTGKQITPGTDGTFAIDGTHRTFYYEVKR